MDVIVKNQAEEREIEEICTAWIRRFPERYKQYRAQVKQQIETLWVSSGMSKEGRFAYEGSIPRELFWEIYRRFPERFRSPNGLIFIQKLMMGDDRPKPQKNFHIIDRTK